MYTPLLFLLLFPQLSTLVLPMSSFSTTVTTQSQSPTPPERRIICHFDINKCIIICDPVKGYTMEDSLNSILTEVIWGEVDSSIPIDNPDAWRIISNRPSTSAPKPGAVTFSHYLECLSGLPRSRRSPLVRGFTSKGGKGENCRSALEELRRAMTVPDMERGISEETYQFVRNGHYFILPSFFNFINEMHRRALNFKVVFRTFGTDLSEICKEMNLFFSGKHALFSPLSTEMQKYRLHLPTDSMQIRRCISSLP